MTEKPMCDYTRDDATHCQNVAKWKVACITPDEGRMRQRVTVLRCYWHTEPKWFPRGTTGVTIIGSAIPNGALATR